MIHSGVQVCEVDTSVYLFISVVFSFAVLAHLLPVKNTSIALFLNGVLQIHSLLHYDCKYHYVLLNKRSLELIFIPCGIDVYYIFSLIIIIIIIM